MEMSYAIFKRPANKIILQRNYLTNGNMTLYLDCLTTKLSQSPRMLLFQKPLDKHLAYLFVLECIIHSEFSMNS